MDMIHAEIDPKRQAENYLRAVGVSYNDLITGDHAAALLADFARHMTSYCNDLSRMYCEQLRLEIEPIVFNPFNE